MDATDAVQHNSRSFASLLDPGNTASRVWPDITYRNLEILKRRSPSERIQFRRAPRRCLSEQQAKANAQRARFCSSIEHVFTAQKYRTTLFVRTIGPAGAGTGEDQHSHLHLQLYSLAWISTRPAPA